MIGGLIPIAGGMIASSNLIVARKPNARELIDKLTPYAGSIGIIMFGWGVWELISVVLNLGMLGSAPLSWLFWLLCGLSDISVGFLLGFGLITKYTMSGNKAALERSAQIRERLAPYQGGLGVFAIVMGVVYLVWLYVL
jgi:hypothetical protein